MADEIWNHQTIIGLQDALLDINDDGEDKSEEREHLPYEPFDEALDYPGCADDYYCNIKPVHGENIALIVSVCQMFFVAALSTFAAVVAVTCMERYGGMSPSFRLFVVRESGTTFIFSLTTAQMCSKV